jgi:GT2 family glycosyltransferase
MLSQARNHVARQFMTTTHDWLWMVDTDVDFPPDTLARLVAAADPDTRPVIGALCHTLDSDGQPFATCYSVERGKQPVVIPPAEDSLMRVDATGCACLLVHRSVLAMMGNFPFAQVIEPGIEYSEDLSFCLRCQAMDIPIYVHTGIRVGHTKAVRLI